MTSATLARWRRAVRRSISTSESKQSRNWPSAVRRRRLQSKQKWSLTGVMKPMVPTASGRARVGLLSRRNPGLYLSKLLASLLAQGKLASSEAEPSYGGIPLKPLPRIYGERLLVARDAAGQVKPTTGGGIYFGLLCADMAADTLHQALQSV